MRLGVCALLLSVIAVPFAMSALKAQSYDPVATSNQQQTLQGLLNDAIVAVRQNDPASACNLRGQALSVLNANFAAFQALYPTNNWSDLQVSLEGSLRKCAPPQGQTAQ
jgi:hypothetical protein